MNDDITWLMHVIKTDIDSAIRHVYADSRWRLEHPEAHYHDTLDKAISCYVPNCAGVDPRTYLLQELEGLIKDTQEKLSLVNVTIAGLIPTSEISTKPISQSQ